MENYNEAEAATINPGWLIAVIKVRNLDRQYRNAIMKHDQARHAEYEAHLAMNKAYAEWAEGWSEMKQCITGNVEQVTNHCLSASRRDIDELVPRKIGKNDSPRADLETKDVDINGYPI